MANTLFIVNDDVFGGLPDIVQKNLLAEVKKIFSFIPHFSVQISDARLIPATLHFTDSVVKLARTNDDLTAILTSIRKQEDANIRFSIKRAGLHLKLDPQSNSPDDDPDRGGVGEHWKPIVVEGGGKTVSVTVTHGVASLEAAEQAVMEEALDGRTLEDVRNDRRKGKVSKNPREGKELELMTKHAPLTDWPTDLTDSVAIALARLVAHEARHQYILAHSDKGLGADSPRIWGDKNFEKFDSSDQADILTAIHQFNIQWNRATVHLETCPFGQPSPFT